MSDLNQQALEEAWKAFKEADAYKDVHAAFSDGVREYLDALPEDTETVR